MKKETYRMTVKGLIYLETSDQELADRIWDSLELYCYRHGFNAILVDKAGGDFIHVKKEKK